VRRRFSGVDVKMQQRSENLSAAAVALGYALLYYALNILVDAYFRTNAPMNPAPMTTLLGSVKLLVD